MTAALVPVNNQHGLTALADKSVTFTYTFLPVRDMQVKMKEDPKTGKQKVESVVINDENLKPTQRFWTSLFARYGFNSAFFKYYDHAEVFTRISEVEANDRMRLCIERDENNQGTLLGVSNPTKPIVVYDELMDLLQKYNGDEVTYHDGIVESTHTPRNGANQFLVGGDAFLNRFLLATPVDGYGAPNIYLSLLRQVCKNGVVGYSKAFKSSLALGKSGDDVAPTLMRALDGFGNEEGYAAIRQRLESSALSWASVYETTSLYKLLVKCHAQSSIHDYKGATPTDAKNIRGYLSDASQSTGDLLDGGEGIGSQLLTAYHRMTGDASKLYGLANLDALSQKRQRTLPVNCTVYDMLNFATEVSSHFATPSGSRAIQGWLGNLITDEYDLEGTREKFTEFRDFHIDTKAVNQLTGGDIAA